MAVPDAARRLIINADDFGRSHSINQAVARAHTQGILTTASLMVTGPAADEAIAIARQLPTLGVGLHLTLICGCAVLPPGELPGLVNSSGCFSNDPARAGLRYFTHRRLRAPLHRELEAQFRRFHATGLPLDHVNGHLHFHLHPTVLHILLAHAVPWNIRHLRLTHDPLALNLRLAQGHLAYRLSHALAFGWLARRARPALAGHGIRHTQWVFGLLQSGRVDEAYVEALLERLPPGDSELYSHPSVDDCRHELEALVSPRVRDLLTRRKVERIRYLDL
jgi:chitin disaccharide deacetylase